MVWAETLEEDLRKAVTWFNRESLKKGPFQTARGIRNKERVLFIEIEVYSKRLDQLNLQLNNVQGFAHSLTHKCTITLSPSYLSIIRWFINIKRRIE